MIGGVKVGDAAQFLVLRDIHASRGDVVRERGRDGRAGAAGLGR
jgi:hypothetical protein